MSAGYRDRMMTPRTFPTPPESAEAAGCTSYTGKLFFDPFAGQQQGLSAGSIPSSAAEPGSRRPAVTDDEALRAKSLLRVRQDLERMLSSKSYPERT